MPEKRRSFTHRGELQKRAPFIDWMFSTSRAPSKEGGWNESEGEKQGRR